MVTSVAVRLTAILPNVPVTVITGLGFAAIEVIRPFWSTVTLGYV